MATPLAPPLGGYLVLPTLIEVFLSTFRIWCTASTISYDPAEGQVFDESRVQQNAMGTYLTFPGGLREDYLGLYSCTSEMETAQHYIVNSEFWC